MTQDKGAARGIILRGTGKWFFVAVHETNGSKQLYTYVWIVLCLQSTLSGIAPNQHETVKGANKRKKPVG